MEHINGLAIIKKRANRFGDGAVVMLHRPNHPVHDYVIACTYTRDKGQCWHWGDYASGSFEAEQAFASKVRLHCLG